MRKMIIIIVKKIRLQKEYDEKPLTEDEIEKRKSIVLELEEVHGAMIDHLEHYFGSTRYNNTLVLVATFLNPTACLMEQNEKDIETMKDAIKNGFCYISEREVGIRVRVENVANGSSRCHAYERNARTPSKATYRVG
jgi:hypothetical protein